MANKTPSKTPRPRKGAAVRSFERLAVRAVDEDARTVELSFSSETPVERWYGAEVLDHGQGAVRLDRLNGGGAVLLDHYSDQIGVVEEARIDSRERKGYATLRFSKSDLGETVFRDIVDGIRRNVSVGYRIHQVQETQLGGGGVEYRMTDWEPYEISIVAVPADASVGVGRDFDDTANHEVDDMADVETTERAREAAASRAAPNVVEINQVAERAREAERERCRQLDKLGEITGQRDLARQHIESGATLEAFLAAVRAVDEAKPKPKPIADLDMPRNEARHYSILRAVNACLTRDWKGAGFEQECSRTIADKLGREARGFYVPLDIWRTANRAMSVGSDSAGGFLVEDSYMAGEFIENLRARAVCLQLGATVLDGLVGDVTIPKKTSSATFYWVNEDEAPTDSVPGLGAVTLKPHTVAGAVPMTRRLLIQSSPSVEALVRSDLLTGAALAIDNAIIDGSGVNGEPFGIVNTSGVNTQAVATDAAPAWAEMVGFESQIAADSALAGNLAYLTTPVMRGTLKTTAKDTGSGLFVWTDQNTVNGYRADVSTQCATNQIIFGNWSEVLVGMWGVLDLKPDEAAKAASGGLVLRVFQDADIALRHPESFCINT